MDYYELGEKFLEKQKWDEAANAYNQAIKVNQNFSWSYYKLGQALAQLQRWDEAIQAYYKAIKLNPDFPWSYHHLGNALVKVEKWSEAIIAYRQIIKINPHSYWDYHKLGEALVKVGEFEEAIASYQTAIKLNPEIKGTYQKLADIFFEVGNLTAAETAYRQAIKLNPEVVLYRQCWGDVLLKQKRFDEAIAIYLEVAKIRPNLTWMHRRLGDAFAQVAQSNLDKTINYYCQAVKNPDQYPTYQKALHLIRENPDLYLQLGNYLAQENQIYGAVIIYYLLLEIFPNPIEIYQQLEKILRQKIQVEQQLNSYYSALETNPDSEYYYHLGLALTQQQKWLEAAIAYHRAIELNPELAWWSDIRLWETFEKRGILEETISLFEQSVENKNNSVSTYLNLAEALTQLGRTNEAIKYYQIACKYHVNKSHPTFVKQCWNLEALSQPDFIIIGVMKGGTTSLYSYITQHPQVLPGIKKEIHFWSFNFHRGVDWYRAHFPSVSDPKKFLTGEASTTYFDAEYAPCRLFNFFPKIKLIVIMRNPIDRAISHYYHQVCLKREFRSCEVALNSQLEKLIKIPNPNYWNYAGDYIASGVYVEFIKRWLAIFPREQLLILNSEDFYREPATTMNQVFNFLGLPDYQMPDYPKLNAGYYSPMSESTRQKLSDYFQPYNQRLEEYLVMKFNW